MSENYIRAHFNDIKQYASVIEKRMHDEGLHFRKKCIGRECTHFSARAKE